MTAEDARTVVDSLADRNVDWVKIRVDDFLDTQAKMPPEAYQALIARATEHNLPVAVHMVELEDAKGVLEAGADLIAHSVRDVAVDQEFIDLLLQNDVCVIPTFTREMSVYEYAERPEWFDDPFFLERAAPSDLEGFITPELQQNQQSPAAVYYREHLPIAEQNMMRLQEAGVKIGFGTDTGTGFPGRFQGYLEHLELQMMVDAGMTPEQALTAATGTTAECIDQAGQVGTLVPGAWADFVVLNANPLENIENTKQVHSVWMSGQQFDRTS
jgi:imidazolonepropionase-like amidohydrolase